MSKRGIGVFDSGLGGLTVLAAIHEHLPEEELIYFGDTARIPYGSKSKETVTRYSFEILEYLNKHDLKMIVVACNTATAYALEELKNKSPVPIIGVIEPGVRALAKIQGLKRAAVIATRSTVRSRAYEQAVAEVIPDLHLTSRACPLFVPLIEEGFADKQLSQPIIREYLDELQRDEIEYVVLGCTHYPIIKNQIQRLYPRFKLVDSSVETAAYLAEKLTALNLRNKQGSGQIKLFVSDITDSLIELEALFFGHSIDSVEKVSLGW